MSNMFIQKEVSLSSVRVISRKVFELSYRSLSSSSAHEAKYPNT